MQANIEHWELPDEYSFVDVLGLDEELLALVPRPVHALILLFPDTPGIVAAREADGPGDVDGDVPLWIPQVDVGE